MLAIAAQWSGFQWIGIGVSVLALLVGAAAVALGIVVLWANYAPEFVCKRPGAINIWSTYRSDVRTGGGERVKCNDDMRITRLIGVAWRFRWFFGVMTFEKDRE